MKNMIKVKRKLNSDSDSYASIGHKYHASMIKKYLKSGSKLLDVGCWTGQLGLALKNENYEYIGVDVEEEIVKYAQAHNSSAKFFKGSATSLPFNPSEFDSVSMFEVLEHIPKGNEERCFREISRVMKKGGIFFLSTPASNILSIILDPAYLLLGHRHYSKEKLDYFFTKHGFKIVDSWISGGLYLYTLLYIRLLYKWILHISLSNNEIFEKITCKVKREFTEKKGFASYHYIAVKV